MTSADRVNILDRIVASKRSEVSALRPRREALREAALGAGPARGFAAALRTAGEVRLLAEVKRRSPSAGEIRASVNPVEIARSYRDAGAAAISVLTDERYFGGSLQILRDVRAAVDLPLLRKDFVIAPEQIWEARAAGADAVLLIVRILDQDELEELHAVAAGCGLDVLTEVHDAAELSRAASAGATLIGVNNRNLATFTTDLELSVQLASSVPSAATLVAESGIRDGRDVAMLGAAGVDAVLVGESLMRQDDVTRAARALTGHPKISRTAR